MIKLNIKPLSVNESYQSKKVKTAKYRAYTKHLAYILPKLDVPEGNLVVLYEFGVSNMQSDTDNMVKPFQDQLQAKYGFNDNKIIEFTARKIKVKKGSEFIRFKIMSAKKINRKIFKQR